MVINEQSVGPINNIQKSSETGLLSLFFFKASKEKCWSLHTDALYWNWHRCWPIHTVGWNVIGIHLNVVLITLIFSRMHFCFVKAVPGVSSVSSKQFENRLITLMSGSQSLFALPLTARKIFFWKLHTVQGTNGDSQSTTINFTFNHKMKSQLQAGVYGWSEKQRSAASLFLTTHVSSICHLGERTSSIVTPDNMQKREADHKLFFFFFFF